MKQQNVYEIRRQKNLYFILPENYILEEKQKVSYDKTAIIICLYYPDTIGIYLEYIKRLPDDVPIYVVSSNETVLEKVKEFVDVGKKKNIFLLNKENRGRDISALLVASREVLLEYRYVCFVHDKSTKYDYLRQDIAFWVKNLWDNTLGSDCYVRNVIHLFEQNDDLGLLLPPEPIGEYKNDWFTNRWTSNFEMTLQLAKELHLNCNLDPEFPPIALGTVFWCRTDALKKMFQREWKYEDFDDEPLADDGTISHAIERILPYVAQDAGYDTGILMTDHYAAKLFGIVQDGMMKAYEVLQKELGVKNISEAGSYAERKEVIKKFCKTKTCVYIYGAGVNGKNCFRFLKSLDIVPEAFVVSQNTIGETEIEGIKVLELAEVESKPDIGIIIAVNPTLQEMIESNLKAAGFYEYLEFID